MKIFTSDAMSLFGSQIGLSEILDVTRSTASLMRKKVFLSPQHSYRLYHITRGRIRHEVDEKDDLIKLRIDKISDIVWVCQRIPGLTQEERSVLISIALQADPETAICTPFKARKAFRVHPLFGEDRDDCVLKAVHCLAKKGVISVKKFSQAPDIFDWVKINLSCAG